MSIKSRIVKAALGPRRIVGRLEASQELKEFIARFRDNYISCDLVRIGGDGDGGYLTPDNLENVKYCFSPGVDYTAKFEKELSDVYGIRSYMADASVEAAPIDDGNFTFIPKFLGNRTLGHFITLSDWVQDSIGDDTGAKILQMDIEGAEYDVLSLEDASTIASFSILIIEFHDLQKLFQSDFLRMVSTIFEKLYKNFSICHVHPNNRCGVAELDGVTVPAVIEVTFLRNDLVTDFLRSDAVSLPHALDRKNMQSYPDLAMPEMWWKG